MTASQTVLCTRVRVDAVRRARLGAVRRPEVVEAALNLPEQDETADQRQQHPEAGHRTHRRRLTFLRVEVPDLSRAQEDHDDAAEDGEDPAEHATDALAAVR